MTMEPTFFATPEDFCAWLQAHHQTETELLVGFYTKGSGKPSITWPQSVDEALCYGWIDGIRRNAGKDAYTIRFTPRKKKSNWSAVNLKRVPELIAMGRMQAAGLAAYEARDEARSRIYAYENRHKAEFDASTEERFRANEPAWSFFQAQPPGYRATATHWVISAKQDATRQRRLHQLIADSAAGNRIAQLNPLKPKKKGDE
jgi:uncharacterized protein YdeI (YjbR/CyaY-like superfamily)